MERLLILGGTGFLGAHVVRLLAERGHAVCVFNRGQTKEDLPASVQHVSGDFGSFGWSGEVISVVPEKLPEKLRVPFDTDHHVVLDSTRIRAELLYAEKISMHAALRDTIVCERRNPPTVPPVFDYDAEDHVLATIR